jgi:uroporphyrinogen-III synthase
MRVKTILVSQPEPKGDQSPYFDIIQKHKVKITFRPFIHTEAITAKEIRAQKIDFNNFTAIIMTSKNAVDYFFKAAEELRYKIPEDLKYFCQSEAIGYYLQKYVLYRKRKIYNGVKDFVDLLPNFKKFPDEKYLIPCSDVFNSEVQQTIEKFNINCTQVVLFKTVMSDLSDLANVKFDILTFFSPIGIKSLFKNFPDFQQNETKIAVFGSLTQKEAIDHGLRIDIAAPAKESPSMTMALEQHIAIANKN